jgi:hypothetical protein
MTETAGLHKLELWRLLDETSVCAMKNLGIELPVILGTTPEEWTRNPEIQKYAAIVNGLRVTNDVAERAVALIDFCNNKRARDEFQLQNLLQVTENHRKRLKTTTKLN